MDRSKEKNWQEITAYLDRIEQLEDGTAKAVFLVEDDKDEFRQFVLPADFLPDDADEGEYLTVTISRDEKTDAKLFRVKVANDSATLSAVDDVGEIVLPADFLPTVDEGEYLTITISRDDDKTQTALNEARDLLNNLEE